MFLAQGQYMNQMGASDFSCMYVPKIMVSDTRGYRPLCEGRLEPP